MSYGIVKTFPTVVVASGASTSSEVALGGKAWDKIGVQVGTMSTATVIAVQNSVDGTTWFNCFASANSSTTQANPTLIATAVGAGGGYVQLHQQNFTRIRFVATAVVSGGISFTVIGSD